MKKFLLAIAFIGVFLASCSKEDNVQTNDEYEKAFAISQDYLTKDRVISSMSNIGATLIETPMDYDPSFEGAAEILIFEYEGVDYYHVYVWNDPNDDNFAV